MQTKKNRDLRRARKYPRRSAQAIAQLLGEAAKAYSAGELATAERLAEQVLSAAPSEPNALNILGVIAAGRGDAARAATANYIATHERDRFGKVIYDVDSIGIDVPARRAAMRDYSERFGIPDEPW